MSQRILITGGAGFIGINAVRHFLKKGCTVTIFDNFSRKGTELNVTHLKKDFASGFSIVRGDIRHDTELLKKEIDTHDVVIHLAAQVAVTTSVTDPRSDFEINLLGTFNVLEAIRESKNKPFLIYASTNKVFGALEGYGVKELPTRYAFEDKDFDLYGVPGSHPLDFHSPYGCSKGAADQYVVDYARIYGLKTVVFRQSCIYGVHQFGVEDQGWLAWFAIATMLGKTLTIYGTGKQVRDALFVEDLVALYDAAIENQDKVSGKAYAIGGGPKNTLSLIELFDHLESKMGKRPDTKKGETRPGDQPMFVADIREAKKDMGWEPKVNIDQGLDRMIGWMKENKTDIEALFAQ
jgi:CDP-paratose 2-epimerase